jgi:glutamate-1-semialdehyde 2,1-aminomutase
MDHVRYIEFTGGEPFMIREHFDMLLNLVQRGLAQNIEIHYNTNGTQWPELAEDIWRHFKTVEIAFSIDDVGARFEYQRANAVWDEVIENLERFRNLRHRSPNIKLQVCCTVNVFNVLYLEEVANWIDQQGFDFVYWNMLHQAECFSIGTLPDSAKQAISQRLRNVKTPHHSEFNRICDFMINGISTDGAQLRKQIALVDQRRNQNFAIIEPEMAALIEYQ